MKHSEITYQAFKPGSGQDQKSKEKGNQAMYGKEYKSQAIARRSALNHGWAHVIVRKYGKSKYGKFSDVVNPIVEIYNIKIRKWEEEKRP